MPRRQGERLGEIGGCWLSRRPNSPAWCRTWYERSSRQTKRASLGTTDVQDAKLKLAEWVVSHGKAHDSRPGTVALEAVLIRYYVQHASIRRSGKQARYALRRWSDFFPAAVAAEVTPIRVRAFVAAMRNEGLSDGTIRRTLAIGRAALNHAYRLGDLAAVPYVDLSHAPEAEPRERILTPDEARRLFATARHDHAWMYLLLAFGTAARPEAILELTSSQVDCEARLIRLNRPNRAQTKKRRPTIPMCRTLVPYLHDLPAGPIVRYDGKALKTIKSTFDRLKTRARTALRDEAAQAARRLHRANAREEAWSLIAGAKTRGDALLELTPYAIRHTVACEMRKRGVPVWEVAGFLGHSSGYRTTERYAKYGPDHLGAAVRAIDAYLADLGVADGCAPDRMTCQSRIEDPPGPSFQACIDRRFRAAL